MPAPIGHRWACEVRRMLIRGQILEVEAVATARNRLVLVVLLVGAMVLPLSAFAQDQADPEATISALQTQVALLEGDGAVATPTPIVTPDDSV